MKSRFLFPHKWQTAGIILFIVGAITHILNQNYFEAIGAWQHIHFLNTNIDSQILLDDFEYLSVIVGLLLIGFSKEKVEDEQIAQLRLDSLQWAVYVNYTILIICIIFINGLDFLSVVGYNIASQLVFFVIRFRWKIYQLTRSLKQI